MSSSQFPQEPWQADDVSITTLTDEFGRSINCYLEKDLEVDGSQYLLLLPVDSPIAIVAWDDDGDDEELAQATLIEDETEIDEIFSDAKAVLAEQDLTLNRSAFTLTVAGQLPELDEEEILTVEIEDSEADSEEFQLLASFYHEQQEYGIYTPLDPLLFFAQRNKQGQIELLSPEEFQKLRPLLEDLLFEELD
ncbi:MAG: DUF3727 domain-containing protein [Symploca sp. SIO3C6]|uniref:DUF3727 domain-containing protein n=1 Tax=Symploca sp. SIO1C4 TaxID=2607765 RepID=A0A6B3NNJ5_9CYAN|nr:DUF3727 domain-containing protein [Symploca sp. SIO3C6]NER31912.1 DUF3727 domain-containing protein [Symploca sp. SIO1C4]NET05585.1 DUF3727 domain-containing protein [Symploca sp. SIO2B6]NET52962.1 DUF3727 domain-containing protein [Merismopedia sp. SIO2A8]